jgi:aminomethyltransferase
MEATATETKRTALYDQHVAAGGKMIPFAGYEMPVRYSGDKAEHMIVREGCGVFDVSHMGEFMIKGPKALELIQMITTNDASKLYDGKAQYSCMPNHEGGIVDDLIVYKFADNDYMLVVNGANVEKDWNWIVETNKSIGAEMIDETAGLSLLAVSGPKATEIVSKLTDLPIGGFENYGFARGTVAGIPNILIATTGYTGERTYEIFIPNEYAVQFWNSLFEVGTPLGLQPTGLGCRDTLRLEMGYMLYGNDINDTSSPLEAGLGWITKLAKGNFNGRDKIVALKEGGLKRKLVGFTVADKQVPRGHYEIASNGVVVGEVTSGSISPVLNYGIGMGYVPVELAVVGGQIDIVIRGKHVPAVVTNPPFIRK